MSPFGGPHRTDEREFCLHTNRLPSTDGDQTSGRVAEARIFPESEGLDLVVFFGVEVDVGHILFSNGEDLEHRGVMPDRLCLPIPADLRAHRDPALNLAIRLAKKAIKLPQHQKPA